MTRQDFKPLIYSSHPLIKEDRFQTWYQWLILAVSITAITSTLLYYTFTLLRYKWRKYKARPLRIIVEPEEDLREKLEAVNDTPYLDDPVPPLAWQPQSYASFRGQSLEKCAKLASIDIVSINLLADTRGFTESTASLVLAYCDEIAIRSRHCTASEQQRMLAFYRRIHETFASRPPYRGVLLKLSAAFTPQRWMNLCLHLKSLNLHVLLEVSPDYEDLIGINLALVDGLVIRSAAILPDGNRRDFFRGFELRDVLGRCARQRKKRPNFITILHDHCERASTPTIRRAYKFARFHEVLISITRPDLSRITQCLPIEEPYSAFDWLKRLDVLDLHRQWNEGIVVDAPHAAQIDLRALEKVIPGIEEALTRISYRPQLYDETSVSCHPPIWKHGVPVRYSYLNTGENGQQLSTKACYDLRDQVTDDHAEAVLRTQKHMRRLKLLHEPTIYERQEIHDCLALFRAHETVPQTLTTFELQLIDHLIMALEDGRLRIFQGLDTGFSLPESRFHMWSVFEEDNDGSSIYLSSKNKDLPAILIHTFMLMNGIARRRCFEIELILAASENITQGLPPRIVSELRNATPSELLSCVQQITISRDADCSLLVNVVEFARYLLVDETTRVAWKMLHGRKLLAEEINTTELYEARIDWYSDQGQSDVPIVSSLTRMHHVVDSIIVQALRQRDLATLDHITKVLCDVYATPAKVVSPEADLLGLMVFSAFRKYGVEETYIESSDRCPLFHFQQDQPGIFSELWVIGSQCEVYFDVTPRELGAMHYARYRKYLEANPPSDTCWNGKDLFTAYHKVEDPTAEGSTPGDPEVKNPFKSKSSVFFPRLQKFAFLSIFCLPAVCDVVLLVFLGRGVFQSAFMRSEEIIYGTLGLLTALLLSSGTIGWIGSSGGYYLYNSAFDSLCHVVVQRFSGGLALTLAVGLLGGLAIGSQQGWYPGLIFFLYLVVLSIYLLMIGILATMHRDGSPFPSGRYVLWKSLPILLLSPIITTYIHNYDIVIYLVVLYAFVVLMLYHFRKSCTEWSQWYTRIVPIDDKKVLEWYLRDHPPAYNQEEGYEAARAALEAAVVDFRSTRWLGTHKKHDELVKSLAPGLEYSRWLLTKDGGPTAEAPPPYSSAWNNSLKVSLNTYQTFVRGLKEHSAFLQWRYSKNDVAYNSVMFIAALLDRWIAITMSAAGDGPLNLYAEPRNRFAIAFALAYFLTSAVALDYQLQFCWTALAATSTTTIKTPKLLDREENVESQRKRALYWTSLKDLSIVMLLVYGLWLLVLVFWVNDPVQLEFFFAYSTAYTFVIWFQFNRVFIKNTTKAWLVIAGAIIVGYFTGVVLHLIPATRSFHFIDVMCLGLCTFLAGLWSFIAADFGPGRDEIEDDIHSPQALMSKTGWRTHSQKFIGLDDIQTNQLGSAIAQSSELHSKATLMTIQSHSEVITRVHELLHNADPHRLIKGLFPDWRDLLSDISDRWSHGLTRVYLILSGDCMPNFKNVAAFAHMNGDDLEVFVPVTVISENWLEVNLEDFAQQIAESLVHETCEVCFQMPHKDAVLSELLLRCKLEPSARMKAQIYASTEQSAGNIVHRTNSEITKHVCLGFEPDLQWIYLPEDLRKFIIARLQGLAYEPNILASQCILRSLKRHGQDSWTKVVQKSDARLRLCLSIDGLVRKAIADNVLTATQPEQKIFEPSNFDQSLTTGNGFWRRIFYGFGTFIKYIAIISNGDPEAPRELIYASRTSSFRGCGRFILLLLWRICSALRHTCIELALIHSRPELSEILNFCRRGIERRLYPDRVVVKDPFNPRTGFPSVLVGVGNSKALNIYSGIHTVEPDADTSIANAVYDDEERLIIMQLQEKGNVVSTLTYQYLGHSRVPMTQSRDRPERMTLRYDAQGRIFQGSRVVKDVNWTFEYTFAQGYKASDVLRARFCSIQSEQRHIVVVDWRISRSNRADPSHVSSWAPSKDVTRVMYALDTEEWELQFIYHHKRDPTIKCAHKNDDGIEYLKQAPEWILRDPAKFFVKPTLCHFESEDLLFHHPPLRKWYHQLFHSFSWAPSRVCYSPLSTAVLRSLLWDRWHKSKSLDGVTACYLDHQILRAEPLLGPYWRARDSGNFHRAIKYLDSNLQLITSSIEVDHNVCQNTFLPYKMSDLYTMGPGGSANVKTRKFEDNIHDTEDRLSVMFLDTGCFPDQPGGVSNCRRDLVNGHTTIRNHVFTESANDFGVPRYQIDRNVNSIKVLPLWGLDYLSPYHGLFDNLLDSQVSRREEHTTQSDIQVNFLPILRSIIKGSRLQVLTLTDLAEFTQAFVDLSIYFEEKDYLKTWKSDCVKRTWRECWLHDQPGAISVSTYFGLELPTMAQFDEALELWVRYFFVFSVRIPEEVPKVFQCTHHGVGSIFGMLLKLRRGTTYMIWDHAIYWRESCLNISSSQCVLGLSVQNMLLGVIRLASHLCYTHADVILPCTNQFNPGWEADIGSDSGRRQNKIAFFRKIDPVVNGISEMERFEPVDKIRTENPTVMMLSNVQFIKDVKNAVLSADIIVNRFKFTKYRLVIYGALDRTPQYTTETEAIIKSRGLENNVKLAGFGNPKEILKDAWAFMNSSLSEGLPLAIGEAALSGAPVIATDVGATGLVISDPKDPKIRYGEIVPPNDSIALARAQIQILAMLGPWSKYCGDEPPPMPEVFTAEDVDWITQRMYDKTEERRALGLKGRETVLHSFNGGRYLREHEQMYWLGSHRAQQRTDPNLRAISEALVKFDEVRPIVPIISSTQSKLWNEDPWRYFINKPGSMGKLQRLLRNQWRNVTASRRKPRHHSVVTELITLRNDEDEDNSHESLVKHISEYYERSDNDSRISIDEESHIGSAMALEVEEVDSDDFERMYSKKRKTRSRYKESVRGSSAASYNYAYF